MEIKKNEESKVEGGEEECVHNEKKEFKTVSFVDNLESVVVAPHLGCFSISISVSLSHSR